MRTSVSSAIAPAPGAPAGEGLRTEDRRDRHPAPGATLERGREPRLRREKRLSRPPLDRVLEARAVELGERRQLLLGWQRDESLRLDALPGQLEPQRRELVRDGVLLRADDEHPHQYFPITRPPSTRTNAPVV
jgi:hypothetical protein